MTCIPKRKFQLRQGGKCTCNFFAMRLQSAASCAPVLDNSWPIQRRRFQDFDNFWTLRPPTALLHIRLESPSQTGKGWRMIKVYAFDCICLCVHFFGGLHTWRRGKNERSHITSVARLSSPVWEDQLSRCSNQQYIWRVIFSSRSASHATISQSNIAIINSALYV